MIVHGSAGGNTSAPTGSLENSGWQWQGEWNQYLATPIAPQYFVTALHVGGSFTGLNLNGVNYTTQNFPDATPFKDFGDLRLWRINGEFPSYAPIYNASVDGSEITGGGKDLVVFGRGTQRGAAVTVASTLKGWEWGPIDGVKRWGQNKVTSFDTVNSANDMIKWEFNASGGGYVGPNEAQLSDKDSGGGVFIESGTEWKLAAINHGATGTYRTSPGGSNFNAAIFDSAGLFLSNGAPANGSPGFSLASRMTPALATFTPWLNLPPTWKLDAPASWTDAASWSTASVPNAIDARADFRTVIDADRTVTLNSAVTVGKISFDNVNRYTISGAGSVTLNVSSGSATMQVASGSHTIGTPVTLSDPINVNVIPATSVLTISNQVSAAGQTITKFGAGTLELKNLRASGFIAVDGTTEVLAGGGSAGTSNVSIITIGSNAQLDLADHDMVVNYSGTSLLGSWNGSAYTAISGAVATGFNNGLWNGKGIVSSNGAADEALTGVAVAEASRVLGVTGTNTVVWSGQTVDGTSVLVKYTYVGDLELDGDLDGDDYFWIDSNIGNSGSVFGYHNGDIDLDGDIDGDDYFWIDSNISLAQQQGPILSGAAVGSAAGMASVPEPAGLGICALAGILLTRRGKRRR